VHQKLVEIPIFGGIPIFAYGTLIVVAFLVAAWWARRTAQRTLGLDPEHVFNVGFALLFLGLAGARLAYAFANYEEFAQRPSSFLKIWEGGLIGYGGLVAGLLFLAWWLPRKPAMRGFAFLDVLARATCIAFAIGWMASLLAGDDYGSPTRLPWGIPASAFEPTTPAAVAAARADPLARLHPTQVYESLFALLLFAGLTLYARGKPVSGRVFAWFLMLHPIGHSVIELFRGDDDKRGMLVPGVLSTSQLLAIPVFFAGLAVRLIRKEEPKHAPPAAP
jgi:phosphatidylglycerol:prolipoprotein diacylglycerol transferase